MGIQGPLVVKQCIPVLASVLAQLARRRFEGGVWLILLLPQRPEQIDEGTRRRHFNFDAAAESILVAQEVVDVRLGEVENVAEAVVPVQDRAVSGSGRSESVLGA
jgi:hypothetical protein